MTCFTHSKSSLGHVRGHAIIVCFFGEADYFKLR